MFQERCIICLHTITNPVCVNCYMKHLFFWLMDTGLSEIHINLIMKKVRKSIYVQTDNHEKCVLCGREHVDICSYCFSFRSDLILRELNLPEDLVENFNEVFNRQNVVDCFKGAVVKKELEIGGENGKC